MSDFDTVKAAVVATLNAANWLNPDPWTRIRANEVAHMLPADETCAMCGREECLPPCPLKGVRQYHDHTIEQRRVKWNGGRPVFLCDTCAAIVCAAVEARNGPRITWVRADRPRVEPEDDEPPTLLETFRTRLAEPAGSPAATLRAELTDARERLARLENNPIIRMTTEDR
ncbi:hypothetical protein BKA00_007459 [Actinomadura coerulea]|uniref:Uncharacterized protein n=1 Tax=Actinomadura coerulea TaxID=46159 RepID=A0A7X0L3E9_9ACTN|nr:hypothetical protein [Actinomadura coerulea]MBB6400545.1 hypothetical protein [Actinomadura coerulea]GGQ08016.1 hypothetical protein GCM10010187_25140 [Actinomadura coerulea]